MDRSLQERLVGAAVLVALGVWLIPWILDGSAVDAPPQDDSVALKLPVPDHGDTSAPIRRETIDLNADRGAATLKAPPRSNAAPVPQAVRQPPPAPEPAPDSASEAPDDAPLVADEVADEAPVASAPQAPVAATPPAAEREPDRAADILAASPVAGWMVQLGSFSDAGNARRQASRISTFGHEARIYEFSTAGGRKMFRVRLGPVDTRERAEAAASALAAHGFVAQLVAPE